MALAAAPRLVHGQAPSARRGSESLPGRVVDVKAGAFFFQGPDSIPGGAYDKSKVPALAVYSDTDPAAYIQSSHLDSAGKAAAQRFLDFARPYFERKREKFQPEVRGGRVEVTRGAGHWLHLTHQREVIAMLRAFLSEKGPAPRGAATEPKFVSAQCPFRADENALAQVRCGYVTVLEDRSTPEGRRLKLAVAVLKSFSLTPHPDPVVYIGGGPGLRIIGGAPEYLKEKTFDALRADRDVVLYDQRGTGFSDPDFCPEVRAEWRRQADSPAARRDYREHLLARCGEIMRHAGVDLSQYNSAVSARDLDDLRRALGYDQWNLYAVSYGARVALAAMRDVAPGIRSIVLDAPLAHSRAKWFNMPGFFVDVLQRLSAACAAQPSCNAAFPNVEQTFWQTVEELERNPRVVQLTRPNGTQATVTRGGASFVAAVSDRMRSRTGLATVPMLINATRAGDEAKLAASRAQRVPTAAAEGRLSPGLWYAVDCFEEAPLNTAELRERVRKAYPAILIDARIFSDPTLCNGFHSFRAGPEHSRPVESDIPTLIFNGEFDLPVHRSSGPLIARSLKNSQSVEIPGAGHYEAFQHECTRTMAARFLDEPHRALDTSCLSSIPRLRFLTDVESIGR